MANALYDNARQLFLEGQFNWKTDTIKALLVDAGAYTVNLAQHKALSDIATSARVAQSPAFTNKKTDGGAADADDITFSKVTGSEAIEAIVLYRENTGSEESSHLIAYIDVATGLPITPNGGDIIVTWDNGANKIFKL